MNKTVKTILKAAGGIAAGTLLVSEFFYESALNVKFINVMNKILPLEDKELNELFINSATFNNAIKWFRDMNLPDTVLVDDKGDEVHGYIIKNPEDCGRWAVCVHGYNVDALAMTPYAKHMYEKGYSVILPSMRAFGEDKHRYASMGYYDKDIVTAWINQIVNADPESKIVVHGVSMGSATTMLVTGEELPDNVKCAVADCGYTSCRDIFASVMKKSLHLPGFPVLDIASFMSKIRNGFSFEECSPVKAVERSKTPTLFIHGKSDDFVPYEMLDKLYNACSAEKQRLDVDNAPHAASILFAEDLLFETIDRFVDKYI